MWAARATELAREEFLCATDAFVGQTLPIASEIHGGPGPALLSRPPPSACLRGRQGGNYSLDPASRLSIGLQGVGGSRYPAICRLRGLRGRLRQAMEEVQSDATRFVHRLDHLA